MEAWSLVAVILPDSLATIVVLEVLARLDQARAVMIAVAAMIVAE
jgi:hypothetical protein